MYLQDGSPVQWRKRHDAPRELPALVALWRQGVKFRPKPTDRRAGDSRLVSNTSVPRGILPWLHRTHSSPELCMDGRSEAFLRILYDPKSTPPAGGRAPVRIPTCPALMVCGSSLRSFTTAHRVGQVCIVSTQVLPTFLNGAELLCCRRKYACCSRKTVFTNVRAGFYQRLALVHKATCPARSTKTERQVQRLAFMYSTRPKSSLRQDEPEGTTCPKSSFWNGRAMRDLLDGTASSFDIIRVGLCQA